MNGRAKLLLAILLIGVTTFLAVVPTSYVEVGDGSFRQAEFQINLVETGGQRLRDIEMVVTDDTGCDSPCYPVSDYYQDTPVKSRTDGAIVFHHVEVFPEFGLKRHFLFTGHLISETKAPLYYCHFMRHGREIAVARFNDYFGFADKPSSWWRKLPTNKIIWHVPDVGCETERDRLRFIRIKSDQELYFPILEVVVNINQ